MSTKLSLGRVRSTYEFIKANRDTFSLQAMCRVLGVASSGYYEWFTHPISNRAQEDARLVRLIRASFTASQGIYGAPRVFRDLREAGETCSKHRVARLMRVNHLRALHGYRTRRWSVGKPSVLIPNLLQRQFTVTRRNKAWSPISPTFGPGRAGFTSLSSWISSRARSSAGRRGLPFTVSSCSTPCSWPCAGAAPTVR